MISTPNDLCESVPDKAAIMLIGLRLVIFTLHDVKAGEELCISYKGIPVRHSVTIGQFS